MPHFVCAYEDIRWIEGELANGSKRAGTAIVRPR